MMKVKTITTVLALLLSATFLFGQAGNQYKFAQKSGKLYVKDLDKVTFQSTPGGEVIVTNSNHNSRDSERAKGLKLINGSGLEDNTGIGLSMEKAGEDVTLTQISRNSAGRYTMSVPPGITIVYDNGSVHGSRVNFEGLKNEIEATTIHSDINLSGVTGPMTINTVHGDIEGDFSTVNQANPISIISTHGDIDIALPSATKADLSMATSWGEIFSDMDIAIDTEKSSMKRYGSNEVRGSINGGGVKMKIVSSHGSIYLRKK